MRIAGGPRRRGGRILAAAAAALCCLLPACADPATGPAPSDHGAVALLLATRQPNVSHELADGFTTGVSQVPGMRAVVEGPDVTDGPAAVRLFEDLTTRTPAGVAVWVLTPTLFFEPLRAAEHAGVPLLALDNPPSDGGAVPLFVGNDNIELGRQLARLVVAQMQPRPTSGTVVLGTQVPGVSVLDERATGLRAELTALLPGVRVLGPFDSRQEEMANLTAWQVLVDAHPEAVAFVGTGDSDSVNLGRLRAETGGRWVAGGFDLDQRALAAVQRGDLVLVSPEHFLKATVAGRLLAGAAASRQPLPSGWVVTPSLPVDRSNIAQILQRQRSTDSRVQATRPQVEAILSDLPGHTRPLPAPR